jgi:hypothetical protein
MPRDPKLIDALIRVRIAHLQLDAVRAANRIRYARPSTEDLLRHAAKIAARTGRPPPRNPFALLPRPRSER